MPKSLNPKERQLLEGLPSRFAGGTFTEIEVLALLGLLRERSKGGPIKELADSIAHSRALGQRTTNLYRVQLEDPAYILDSSVSTNY